MDQSTAKYDCIVIGGGPAGATVAALVAEAGLRTLVVERDAAPRRRVGESLMPETYWTFERLGLLDELQKSTFPQKVGVQFVSGNGRESQPFLFRTHDDRECSRTWHVERTKFDPLLLAAAAAKGAEVCRGARVRDVIFEDDRAVGIRMMASGNSAADSGEPVVRAPVVVDATGQQGLLAGQLSLRKLSSEFRKVSIWGHFRGARRDVIEEGVMTVILRSQSNNCWFWHIPLADDVVSIGLVGDADYLLRDRGTSEQVFHEEVANCPGIKERLAGAERSAGLDVVKEFSYTTERSAGDGWVLVGDAWGFIDPIYSSGVWFALKSGELAADCIIEGRGDTSAEQLGQWLPDFQASTNWIRKLVRAFYSGQFRVGQFVKEYPQHNAHLIDLLIGRIFHPDAGRIFDDLDPWLERMEQKDATS